MFVLGSGGSPGVVEFETLIAEVGLAVSTALRGLQRQRRFTETTHDGYAAQIYCVPIPGGEQGRQGDKVRFCSSKTRKKARKSLKRDRKDEFVLLSFQ